MVSWVAAFGLCDGASLYWLLGVVLFVGLRDVSGLELGCVGGVSCGVCFYVGLV